MLGPPDWQINRRESSRGTASAGSETSIPICVARRSGALNVEERARVSTCLSAPLCDTEVHQERDLASTSLRQDSLFPRATEFQQGKVILSVMVCG